MLSFESKALLPGLLGCFLSSDPGKGVERPRSETVVAVAASGYSQREGSCEMSKVPKWGERGGGMGTGPFHP